MTCDKTSDKDAIHQRIRHLASSPISQRTKLRSLFTAHTMRRAGDLRAAGIGPQTIARAVEEGALERISRGLYQRRDSEIEEHQILAEAAIRVPKGVIALTSALAFHGLTDQMPRRIWMATGASDWSPVQSYPPLRIVRFVSLPLPLPSPVQSARDICADDRHRWSCCVGRVMH
ncbi:MAG: type IV toxin-antitoxin system AbiEi family antitoxin domain-containing protein [Sphingomonas sp.]|uniref:type IV toxin-antitoxin system AbiEi family antitoxin domain-containing protein n=1 Tax=Sphingomonas sp. TaxID=28214 RepID=UPI003F80FA69